MELSVFAEGVSVSELFAKGVGEESDASEAERICDEMIGLEGVGFNWSCGVSELIDDARAREERRDLIEVDEASVSIEAVMGL